ncbi:MAG: GEVED domain-containing protein [Bacteroidota bacterium]|nr:GEVED domain-containing protein [Bacteroidota bacterium]
MKNFISTLLILLALAAVAQSQPCTPSYSTGTVYGDYISRVKLDSIDNQTSGLANPYYHFYSNISTTLSSGQTYYIKVAPGSWTGSGNDIAAWIDYNANDTFEVGEKIGQANNLAALTMDSFSFTVLANTAPATVKLRVRESYSDANMGPCSAGNYGECEDYIIHIISTGGNAGGGNGGGGNGSAQVCVPSYSTGSIYGDYISFVKLDSINNQTAGLASPFYSFYSNLSTTLYKNQAYYLKVAAGTWTGTGNNIAAWIDYNGNDTFEASEKLGQLNNMAASTLDSINFTIPANTANKALKMRVRELYNGLNMDPCTGGAFGECEDYTIYVSNANNGGGNGGGGNGNGGGNQPVSIVATTGAQGPKLYNTLKEAFDSINSGYHTGSIILNIIGDCNETDSCVLKSSGTGNANYTSILVKPSGDTTRTITMNSNRALIQLNGADNVTIDGLNTNGNSLILDNQSTGNVATVVLLMNDATSDTIRNCKLKGAVANILGGVVSIYNTYLNTGNDNNAIVGCDIGSSGNNKPYFGIYSGGTVGKANDGIFVDNCKIHDFQAYALYFVNGGNNCTITSNKIYQPDTTAGSNYAVNINGGTGHTVSYNIIGGNDSANSGYWVMKDGGAYFCGINIFSQVGSKPIKIEGNIIKRVSIYDIDGGGFCGVAIRNISTTYVTSNDIGEYANIFSIQSIANTPVRGISTYGYNRDTPVYIHDNYVMNMTNQSATSNVQVIGIVHEYFGKPIITNNYIYKLTSYSTTDSDEPYYAGTAGIVTFCFGDGQVINNNEVRYLKNLSSANVSASVIGIGESRFGSGSGSVANNKISQLENRATGNYSQIIGIYTLDNTSPGWKVYNNMINITNSAYTNGVTIHGILSRGYSDTLNVYYNTVFIGGSSTSTNNSYAFCHLSNASIILRNNLLYNKRTGSGNNFAVANIWDTTGWLTLGGNYNLFITADSTKIGRWYNSVLDFAHWKTRSRGDASSWSATSDEVNSDSLFTTTGGSSLYINNNKKACWYVNGKGVAGTLSANINTDLSGDARSIIHGMGTDIGADEFVPVNGVNPPDLSITGSHQTGGTETFSFAGRVLATITWGNAGSLPAFNANSVKYYSGKNPNSAQAGSKYANAYWYIEPTGGNGFSYDITLNYDDALTGNIVAESNVRLAKKPFGGNNWTSYDNCNLNTNSNTCQYGSLNSFSEFTLNDNSTPLPVTLLNFAAQKKDNDIYINWDVVNEQNFDHYEVERSFESDNWEYIGEVASLGLQNKNTQYNLLDMDSKAIVESSKYKVYYRLKMVDLNGEFSYSKIVSILSNTSNDNIAVYPMPFTSNIIISNTTNVNEQTSYIITDIAGKTVVQNTIHTIGNSFTIKGLESLPSGIYMISVASGTQTFTSKLFKQ